MLESVKELSRQDWFHPRGKSVAVFSLLYLAKHCGLFPKVLDAPFRFFVDVLGIPLNDETDPVKTNDAVLRIGFPPGSLSDLRVSSFSARPIRKVMEGLIQQLLHAGIRLTDVIRTPAGQSCAGSPQFLVQVRTQAGKQQIELLLVRRR